MSEKKTKENLKIQLALFFASLSVLVLGFLSALEDGGITYYAMVGLFNKVFPGVLIIAALGWVIGYILEKSVPPKKTSSYNNMLMNELMDIENSEGEQNIPQESVDNEDANVPSFIPEPYDPTKN